MDILEEISKLTQLPKPIKTAKFETITKSPEEAAGAAIDFKLIKSKNVKLYDPEPEQNDTNGFNNHFLNEYEFLTSIQELGCGSSSNRDIEERWRKRVELNESRLKEETVAKKPEQVIKKPVQRTPQYKNNALMRGLLDKKMALEVSNEDKNIDSERNIINVPLYNNGDLLDEDGPVLTALSEDPEIFCLRDTAGKKSDIIYDDYRFAHHGKKTTVTPRFYSHYEIDDKDFEFKKK